MLDIYDIQKKLLYVKQHLKKSPKALKLLACTVNKKSVLQLIAMMKDNNGTFHSDTKKIWQVFYDFYATL